MSPASRCCASVSMVASTTAAGTIIQIARGFVSAPANASTVVAPVAPSFVSAATALLFTSYATQV